MQGSELETIRAQLDHVASNCQPRLDEMDAAWADKSHIRYSRLLLPLSSDGRLVDRMIGHLVFEMNR